MDRKPTEMDLCVVQDRELAVWDLMMDAHQRLPFVLNMDTASVLITSLGVQSVDLDSTAIQDQIHGQ